MLYRRPDLLHRILEVNAQAVAQYLNAQIEAGAQAVMIFDSWGGALADGAFQAFSLDYIRRVLANLRTEREEPETDADGRVTGTRMVKVPSIVFTKGGGLWLEEIAASGCDAVGVDWTVNLARARAAVGARCALQGNLDPMALMAAPGQVQAEARKVLDSYGAPAAGEGHVFNRGPRHLAVHPSGERFGAGRGGASAQPGDPRQERARRILLRREGASRVHPGRCIAAFRGVFSLHLCTLRTQVCQAVTCAEPRSGAFCKYLIRNGFFMNKNRATDLCARIGAVFRAIGQSWPQIYPQVL